MEQGAGRARTRVLDVSGKQRIAFPRASLTVEAGPAAGRAIELASKAVRVGSDASCDLLIEDPSVSGLHCELRPSEHGVRLRDLGSTNGTWVDGRRVVEIFLAEETRIVLGTAELRFRPEDGEASFELSRATNFGGLLGQSPAMRAAFALLEGAAKTDATVLVTGETGTGKELAARALHDRSARAGGPFVILDCGASSASLLEAQLFGHARGAFTGASEAREGVFEAADGGTLVLDEIGELPLELQPKLLRALEARTVTRLGESKPRSVDVRFVASTHRDLAREVAQGRFRQDLFFRLSVVAVELPPLRDRPEEIPRLLSSFLAKLARGTAPELPPYLTTLLKSHSWPGNVRELRNFAERFLVAPELAAKGLAPSPAAAATHPVQATPTIDITARPFHEAKRDQGEAFEKAYLEALLARWGDNISEAARVAGLSRQTCYRLMLKYGLRGLE